MTITIRPFDAAKYLDDEESQRYLLNDAIESGDAAYIAHTLGTIARAKGGLTHLEHLTGIKRQTLNKSLGKNGNPTLETLLPVLKGLGLQLKIEPAAQRELAHA